MPIIPNVPLFPLPVPSLPESFDLSLSYMELLAKLTEAVNAAISQVNSLNGAVSTLQSDVFQLQEAVGDIPAISAAVTQLQTDLTAEIAARIAGDEQSIRENLLTRNMVMNDYVSFEDLAGRLGGGINLTLISRADYDDLSEYDNKTIYFVQDVDGVKMYYMGSEIVASLSGGAVTVFNGGTLETISGNAVMEE